MSIWEKVSKATKASEKVDGPDYAFGVKALKLLDALAAYFRVEIHGLDRIPPGPGILVGNHNSGITFFDPMFLGAAWYRHKQGTDDFIYLIHDAMLATPGLGTFLRKMGAARASTKVAEDALASGRKIMVYPGGNYEAFRPWKDRFRVDMGGHKGFCKLALRKRVPIVPVVGVGAHETFFVISRGERIARWTGLGKLLRMETFPIALSVPWGLTIGPIFHFPLPAKISLHVGDPIPVDDFAPDAADDPAAVDRLYELVSARMQALMDEGAAMRRLPVLG